LLAISVVDTKPQYFQCSDFIEHFIDGVKVFFSIVEITDTVLDDDEALFFRTKTCLSGI
jgi:hypothetical protein